MRLERRSLVLTLLGLVGLAQAAETRVFSEGFQGALASRWEQVRIHDTRADKIEAKNGRLAISLDTLKTDDATVKLRGVRTRDSFAIGPARLRFGTTVDWNDQVNGCYLTAGLALVPESYTGDPRTAPESLSFEWIGVPPGKNVRPYLVRRRGGALLELYTEGWPQPRREERVGRPPSKSPISLEVAADDVRLLEGGKELFRGKDGMSGKVRLVLFVTGHSNYPERTVYFDGATIAEVRS